MHREEEKGKERGEKKEKKHRLGGGVLSPLRKKGPVGMAGRVSQRAPRRSSRGVQPALRPAGPSQTRLPRAENPGRGRAAVVKALGTWLHRPGKDQLQLGAGSLNPHPINEVPRVKPIKDPG